MWIISKYLMVGLANTLLTMIVIFTLMHLGMGLYPSNAIGYLVGIIFSFILNSLFTFSIQLTFWNLIKFFLTCLICYVINLIAIKVFFMVSPYVASLYKGHIQFVEYIAQIFGMFFYTVTGFILNKFWVMK